MTASPARPAPRANLATRLRAAWFVLRGRPVAFRLQFGVIPGDKVVYAEPGGMVAACGFTQHFSFPGVEPHTDTRAVDPAHPSDAAAFADYFRFGRP